MVTAAANPPSVRRAGAVTFLLTAMVGVGIWLVFYPGIMSYDSIDQYRQARTGQFNSAHPPIMAAVLFLVMQLGRNIGLLMLVQCLAGVLGIRQAMVCTIETLCGRRSAGIYWAAVGLTFAILSPLTPAVFYLMTFWKDCWTAYALVWVVALSLALFREAPQLPGVRFFSRLAILLVVMAFSAMPRHNGLVVMPAMGLLIWGILLHRGVRYAWPAIAIPVVLAVVAQSSLDRALHVKKTYTRHQAEVADLLGLCVRFPEERVRFPYVSSHMREGIDQYYRIGDISAIAFEHPEIIDQDLLNLTYNPELDAEYKRAVLECPGKLFHIKYLAFRNLLAPANSGFYYYHRGIIENPFGLRPNDRFAPARDFYDATTTKARTLPVVSLTSYHAVWFGVDLVLLAVFTWRSIRWRGASDLYWIVVLLVPASYTLGYLLATVALDYRYLYPSTLLVQVLAGAMVLAKLFPQTEPVPIAARRLTT